MLFRSKPYYVIREGGFAQPVLTGTNKYKIGNGQYATALENILKRNGVDFSIKDAIRESNRQPTQTMQGIMERAAYIDDAVADALAKLPRDKYYIDPNDISAIAVRDMNSGKWRIHAMENKHIKYSKERRTNATGYTHVVEIPPRELYASYNTPQEAIAAWQQLERIKQRKPVIGIDGEVEQHPVYKKLTKYAEDELISKKTPQYRVEHAPEETYIDYNARLTDQTPYVRDRLANVMQEIDNTPNSLGRYLNKTGWELYTALGKKISEHLKVSEKEGRKLASRYLNSIGVGGLRYPSSGMGSMAGNAQLPNYVHFFDPTIVETNIKSRVQQLKP